MPQLSDASLRVGTATPTAAYLGATKVWPPATGPAAPRLLDEFTRTSTTSPGTASTGQGWFAEFGTWGTDGANLYSVNGADDERCQTNIGASTTQDISTVITVGAQQNGTFPGLLARYNGFDHYYLIMVQPDGAISLVRRLGAWTDLPKSATGVYSNGQTLRFFVREDGNATRLTVYVNGTQVLDYTDNVATRPSGQSVGFRVGTYASGNPIKWGRIEVAA